MLTSNPTVAVIGAGAVGLYYGGRLARAGTPVHFLVRSDHAALTRHGLRVASCDGDFHLPPDRLRLHTDPREMPPADLVLIAFKTTSNDLCRPLVTPVLKPGSAILTFQNGLGNEDHLASLFPAHRVYGGIAFTCIHREPEALVRHTSHGLIRLGRFAGPPDDHTRFVADLLRSAEIRCEVLDDLARGRWAKLIWNVPFNGLGAALDLATDQILASDTGAALVERLMREVIAAAAAANRVSFPDADEIIRDQIGQTREMARYRTSMQLDRQAGRPMEVDAIIGEPLRRGVAAGASLPEMASLYHLLQTVDRATSIYT